MEPTIIYTDKNLIVVNKPPGIAVHGKLWPKNNLSASKKPAPPGRALESQPKETTLIDILIRKFPEIQTVGDDPSVRPGIVHRLDKDTSGVMVVARTQRSFEIIKSLFKNRAVEKIYLAISQGIFKQRSGTITLPLGRLPRNPTKRGTPQGRRVVKNLREALTPYRVLYQGSLAAIVELKPKTGRMHQVRVHLAAIGHPVACDTLYGGKNVWCPLQIPRHLLHAQSLSFSFPDGKRYQFEADSPEDFSRASRTL